MLCANVCIKKACIQPDTVSVHLPTIKEIAKIAGVSYSTVSRALNHKKGVGKKKREGIVRLAEQLGYFPNSSARALVKKQVGVIGVVIPRSAEFTFQSPFFSQILMGISTLAREHGYHQLLSINDPESYASLYYRHLVDGLIVVGNRFDDPNIAELEEKGIPSVVIPGFPDESSRTIATVNSENFKSVQRAVTHLIELGHRRIAFILGQMTSKYSLERLQAYQAAFRIHHLEYDPRYVVESDFSKPDAYRLMGELLDRSVPPTAVICINDTVTFGALYQINHRNLRIPDDISLVAIGGSDLLDLYAPSLTTIRIPVARIGKSAAKLLIQMAETGRSLNKHLIIPSKFVIGESTGICRR